MYLVTGPSGLELNMYSLSEEADIIIITSWAKNHVLGPDLSWTTDFAGGQEEGEGEIMC